jgi:predicted ArsR family transcriptional regulator
MSTPQAAAISIEDLDLSLERDWFVRSLIRELSGLLEDVVGLEEASGFISVVGQKIGNMLDQQYRQALDISALSPEQIGQVLVDLKRRINGDFYIIEQDEEKIVLGNHACPFADKVKNRPSLCMMTSNVFGTITAENNGYAKVALEKTIAEGENECRVVVYLKSSGGADIADGREYFKAD